MDDLNINNLPPEVLTKVFRFLDLANLKNATLTCKLWNNLIESTCRWPLNLNYDVHGQFESKYPNSAEQKMLFILTTNRKFGKIEIEGIDLPLSEDDEDHQIYQIFKRHGFNVVELTLYFWQFNNLVSIAQLLNLTPNLTYVNMRGVHLQNATSDVPLDQVLPNLKKLKYLDIGYSDQRTIECFRKAKLTTMKIGEPSQDRYRQGHIGLENRSPLVDFLLSQDILTSLYVDSKVSSILIELGKMQVPIPFRLTRLESSMVYGASSHDKDNFLRFVKTQAASLRKLKLGDKIPNSVYECVFASMTKLNTLDVAADGIPRDSDFYKQLKENCSIHTVKLYDGPGSDARCVVDFFKKLPNIRHLILPLNFGKNVQSVTLPNLKALDICFMLGKINWNEFTKAHPLLAELTIWKLGNKSYLTSDDIDQITTNVALQHVRLGVGFVADDRFFEIVRSKCTSLKTLDLDKSCLPHGLNDNVGINVLRLYDFACSFRALWCPQHFKLSSSLIP